MINFARIDKQILNTEPFEWAFVDELFSTQQAWSLVKTFPRDNWKSVKGSDGERAWEYKARGLVHLGANAPRQKD